jgi:hypothetical protein
VQKAVLTTSDFEFTPGHSRSSSFGSSTSANSSTTSLNPERSSSRSKPSQVRNRNKKLLFTNNLMSCLWTLGLLCQFAYQLFWLRWTFSPILFSNGFKGQLEYLLAWECVWLGKKACFECSVLSFHFFFFKFCRMS